MFSSHPNIYFRTIKIYPPSLWDNGYIWWAGVECERLSWGALFLDYLQSLGDEHSFSALISIVVNGFSCYRLRTALAANHRGGPHLTPTHKNISAVPLGQRVYLVGRGGVREIVMGVLSFSTISNLSAASIASPLSFQ